MSDPRQALERLAAAPELADVCRRFNVELLVVFGSAVQPGSKPRDLDLAVRFTGGTADLIGFVDALSVLANSDDIDLMDLGRAGLVAREQALVKGIPLFEAPPGTFARAQMAAATQRMDTEWLRRMELELMARRRGGGAPGRAG